MSTSEAVQPVPSNCPGVKTDMSSFDSAVKGMHHPQPVNSFNRISHLSLSTSGKMSRQHSIIHKAYHSPPGQRVPSASKGYKPILCKQIQLDRCSPRYHTNLLQQVALPRNQFTDFWVLAMPTWRYSPSQQYSAREPLESTGSVVTSAATLTSCTTFSSCSLAHACRGTNRMRKWMHRLKNKPNRRYRFEWVAPLNRPDSSPTSSQLQINKLEFTKLLMLCSKLKVQSLT